MVLVFPNTASCCPHGIGAHNRPVGAGAREIMNLRRKKKPNKTKFRGRKFPLTDQSKTDSEVERGRVLDIQLLNDCMKTKAGTDSSFLAPSPPLPPSLTFFKEGDLIWRIRLKWTINSSKIGRWGVNGQRKLFAKCVHIENHRFAKTSSISVGLLNIWWCAFENWESP